MTLQFNNNMSIIGRLFHRKSEDKPVVGGMEDFMLLIRVYYQASMAAQVGINNLAALPDLRIFKHFECWTCKCIYNCSLYTVMLYKIP